MTTALTIMGGVFAIILVIVCINVANLTLSRDSTRRREIAIRSAIGASRWRLARQFLVEGIVLTVIGAIAALGLAHLGLTFTPIDGVESHVLDFNVLAFVFGLTIMVGLLLGIVSAAGASRSTRPVDLSQGQDAMNPSRGMAGRALVVVQVALSLVLVIGAGLFLGTLANLRSTPSGFNPDDLAVLFLGMGERGLDEASRSAFYERLSSFPGVESFAPTSDALFGSGQVRYSYPLDGDDPESTVSVPTFWVGPGFLDVNEISVLSGRGFEPQDERTDRPVAVVTETFVREFFDGRAADALGHRLPVFDTDVEIVGISADAKYGNLREAARPMVYIVDPGQAFRLSRILIRTSIPPDQVMPAILDTARSFNPEGRFSIASQQEEIARTYRNEWLYAVAASLFGALALAVSMVGLFGLLSYAVSRRTKEIGIRMAVGARKATILGSVLGESLKLVSTGIILGLGGAFVLTRYLQSLLYGLEPNDPKTLLAAVAVMIAVSIAAAFVPAHRAASVNPMVALRHD